MQLTYNRVSMAGPGEAQELGQLEVEALAHGMQVADHKALDVRVTQLDRVSHPIFK